MAWKPAGLLEEAASLKAVEVQMLENIVLERPDHPINLKLSYFAPRTDHSLSRSVRRRDGTLAVLPFMKRFDPPVNGKLRRISTDVPLDDEDTAATLVHPLPNLPDDVRAMWAVGADACVVSADFFRHGIDGTEFPAISARMRDAGNNMPIIKHDIFVAPIQIAEAAAQGATAVSFVAGACLADLPELLDAATMMGLECIVECHSKLEVDFAMECGATILALSNWDRARNILVPGTAKRLIEVVPPFVTVLAGGGISSVEQCWELLDYGFNGVLLGTAMLRANRPSIFVEEVRSHKRFTGDITEGGVPFAEGTNI